MLKYISIFVFVIYGCFNVYAQDNQLVLSLNDAMEYALKNRPDLQNAYLKTEIASNEVDKLYALVSPKITSSFDVRYNSQLQTNVIPAGAFGNPDTKKVQFGTKYNTSLGFDLQQALFDPTFKSVLGGAKANIVGESLASKKAEIDVKFQVAQNYYATYLANIKLKVAQQNVNRTEKYYEDAKSRFENGTLLKNDLDRFYLDLLNAKVTLSREINNVSLAKANLQNTIAAPINSNIVIKDSISSVKLELSTPNVVINPETRIEFKQELNANKVAQFSINRYKFDALPKVNLYAFYGTQALRNNLDIFNGTAWNPYNYIGLKVNFTIFDGSLRKNNVDQAKLQLKISENNLQNWKRVIANEQQSAYLNLQNTYKSVEIAKDNLVLAEKLLQSNQDKFKEGTITNAELFNAEKTLIDTQSNYLSAIYDFIIAQLTYQKAQTGL